MNQILYVQKNNNKSRPTIEITKIIRFFAIALMIFGVIMIGQGSYGVYQNNETKKKIENAVPVASIERQGQYLRIYATHNRAISTIVYNWNGEDDVTIDGNGRTTIQETIELPAGNNIFNLTVTDVNGKNTKYQREFSIDTGRDITKPKIEMTVVGNYVKITASDETALSYLTYRWNEDEEQKVEPTQIEPAKIETNVEIQRGKNTLTVIAVDSSNNTSRREETFEGRTKPTLEVYVDGDELLIIAKHDMAIERMEVTINGKAQSIQNEPKPTMEYRPKLDVGYNKVSIKAYSTEGTVAEFDGECTYTPPVQ